MNPLSKTPILSLLVPLILGIILQYFFEIQNWSVVFLSFGVGVMLLSYFMNRSRQFSYRWLFGLGMVFFVIGVGIVSTHDRQQSSVFIFESNPKAYRAVVVDIPQDKPKTIAYRAKLPDYDKNIVCYFQIDSLQEQLKPGDEFLFYGTVQPFRNFNDSSDFDYVTYMFNQGFAGSVYISADKWKVTGNVDSSLKIYAQRCRQKILDVYKSLNFSETEISILAALTIGYQGIMPDDLKQSFRTTGTIHVLSVSGLHVGIIYVMISFLLSFLHRSSRYYKVKPVLVIALLWIYAFLAGLSPSVTRASIMLTMFCVAELFDRKNDSIHAMYIAAFLILLHNPFSLFHIGFQLSFMSVLAILYLHPKVLGLLKIRNKWIRYIWQSFTLSCVAQLATFPLCLYYFGTFPTYFFITNLVIVPLVMLIIYAFGGIVAAKLISYGFPNIGDDLFYIPTIILQFLFDVLVKSLRFFESIPFALIQGVKISFVDMLLIVAIIIVILQFLLYRRIVYLKLSLALVLGLLLFGILFSIIE